MRTQTAIRIPVLAAVAALFLSPGRAAASGRDDSISSSTSAGVGEFIQSFEVYRHVMSDGPEESYFARHHDDSEDETDPSIKPKQVIPSEPTKVAWNLGYSFDSSTTPSTTAGVPDVADITHTFLGGLEWEALPVLDLSSEVSVDTIPSENYRHGRVALRFEYYLSLQKEAGTGEDDEEARIQRLKDEVDARSYYKHLRDGYEKQDSPGYLGHKHRDPVRKDLSQADPDDDEDESDVLESKYPHLRVALDAEFDRHLKEPTSATRIPGFKQPGGDIFLNQYGEGLELILGLNESWTFKATGMFFYYNFDPNLFEQFLEGGSQRRQNALAATGLSSLTNQLTTFPTWTFSQQATRTYNDRFSLDLELNETFYAVAGIGASFTASPVLNIQMDKQWGISPGAAVTLQSGSVTLLGTLSIVYTL